MPSAQASLSGWGSYNRENLYWGSNRGDVYVERAPGLMYDPKALSSSLSPNGFNWYVNMYGYANSIYWYSPDELYLSVYILDKSSSAGSQKWFMDRFWPISTQEFGTTVSWSFGLTVGTQYVQGGISGTVSSTRVSKITYDTTHPAWVNGWYYLGKLSIDFNAKFGLAQIITEGAMRLAIYNRDGPTVLNHYTQIKLVWQGVWRGCTPAWCIYSHRSMYITMILGDNVNLGDNFIYVYKGTTTSP